MKLLTFKKWQWKWYTVAQLRHLAFYIIYIHIWYEDATLIYEQRANKETGFQSFQKQRIASGSTLRQSFQIQECPWTSVQSLQSPPNNSPHQNGPQEAEPPCSQLRIKRSDLFTSLCRFLRLSGSGHSMHLRAMPRLAPHVLRRLISQQFHQITGFLLLWVLGIAAKGPGGTTLPHQEMKSIGIPWGWGCQSWAFLL